MATATTGLEVLTLPEAARFLRVSEEAVLRAVSNDGLEGRQLDGEWRFLKSGVEDWLLHRSPKARFIAQAGTFKDDPYLGELLERIESERARDREETP